VLSVPWDLWAGDRGLYYGTSGTAAAHLPVSLALKPHRGDVEMGSGEWCT